MLLKQKTKTKEPRVFALYTDTESSTKYIVTELIEGDTLDTRWSRLTECQKRGIVSTLKGYFDELRSLPSPGYFGGIGKTGLLHRFFRTPQTSRSMNGPLYSETALNEAVASNFFAQSDYCSAPQVEFYRQAQADFYRQAMSEVSCNHPPTFSHSDFQDKNIIVRQLPDHADESQYEVTLIGWEVAGRCPSYWEYSVAMSNVTGNYDWDGRIEEIYDHSLPNVFG